MKKIILLLLLAMLATVIPVSAQSDDLPAQLDTYLTRLADLGFSGSVMIVADGEVILNDGYGLANTSTNAPNTPDTMFAIGSIAKLYTAMSILQLHDAGMLNVEDPISMYFDDVPEDKAEITFVQLINHMSGLDTYHDTEGDFQMMTRDEAYQTIMNTPLLVEPGTEGIYSNSGYTLLAMLIEVVSGQTYQDYIHDHIFAPLEMTRSGFHGETFDNMAYTRNTFDGYGTPADWDYSWVLVGNGGIVSSTADLHRFMTAIINYELATQETIAYWVDLSQLGGWVNVAGGGDDLDYNASIYFNADQGVFIYNLTNTIDFLGEFVNLRLGDFIDSGAVILPPEVEGVAIPDSETCFDGLYRLESGGVFTISSDDVALTISAIGQDALALLTGITSPQTQNWYADLTSEVEGLLSDISTEHFSPLSEAFGVPDEVGAEFWAYLESVNGAFVSHDLIGTTASDFGEDEPVTVIYMHYAGGDVYVLLYWDDANALIDIDFMETGRLIERRLFTVVDGNFVTFSLLADDYAEIQLSTEAEGETSLEIAIGDIAESTRRAEQLCD